MFSLESYLSLLEQLIRFRSLDGAEDEVFCFVRDYLQQRDWNVQRFDVYPGRWNLLATVGEPEILFTTHLDVVPASDQMFEPRRESDRIVGRGSCDAKGIAALMIFVCEELRRRGEKDFGMAFVFGEETDSLGAKALAKQLQGQVKYVVNGEPTECILASGHKGMARVVVGFSGRSAHSGYPELGEDANAKLVRFCSKVYAENFGEDPVLGPATINCGQIKGGVASNVISPSSEVVCAIRTVGSNQETIERLRALANEASSFEVKASSEPVRLLTLAGMESKPVSYGTDIPSLMPIGAQFVLYGPGWIGVAHTEHEFLAYADVQRGFEDYLKIYQNLKRLV